MNGSDNSRMTGTGQLVNGSPVVAAPLAVLQDATGGPKVKTQQIITTTGAIMANKPIAATASPIAVPMQAGLQIVNVRPNQSIQMAQARGASPRMLINPMSGIRPTQPGQQLTFQAIQGIAAGTQGHIIVKTDSGQLQLVRVNTSGNANGTTVGAGMVLQQGTSNTFRIQPQTTNSISTLPISTASQVVPTIIPTTATATASSLQQANVTTVLTNTTQANQAQSTPPVGTQTVSAESAKSKCKNFLSTLLRLASEQRAKVAENVYNLIQGLIDGDVEPEVFTEELQRDLNSNPQPCLVPFLKKTLPYLRASLAKGELSIEGVRPPPLSAVQPVTGMTTVIPSVSMPSLNNIRPNLGSLSQVNGSNLVVRSPLGFAVSNPPNRIAITPQLGSDVSKPPNRIDIRPQLGFAVNRPPNRIDGSPQLRSTVETPNRIVIRPSQMVSIVRSPAPNQRVVTPTANTIIHRPVTPQANNTRLMNVQQLRVGSKVVSSVKGAPATVASLSNAQVNNLSPVSKLNSKSTKDDKKAKDKNSNYSTYGASSVNDDDINDVAAMGGVNLGEESQRILDSTGFVGTQIRSCKDEIFLASAPLSQRVKQICSEHGMDEPSKDVLAIISNATQERLKCIVQKLGIYAEHRLDLIKTEQKYEVVQDVKSQLKFLEELHKLEKKRKDEQEREILLRAAKSRNRTEDPEQAKLKAKAKEMQRIEQEETRQREANLTALSALQGPRPKKQKVSNAEDSGTFSGTFTQKTMPIRPRVKRVNMRDMMHFLEQDKDLNKSQLLYKSYLK